MDIKIAELLPLATESKATNKAIHKALTDAYEIDRVKTLKLLLYIRDKNNGAGRRDFFRTCLLWIKNNDEETFNKILIDVLLIGRWDDIFYCEDIINDQVLDIILSHLEAGDTLLKKWLPKESSNPDMARIIAKGLGYTMKEYRLATRKGEEEFTNTIYRPIDSYYINI